MHAEIDTQLEYMRSDPQKRNRETTKVVSTSLHAGTLGWIPWTYRTYPDLVSTPPFLTCVEKTKILQVALSVLSYDLYPDVKGFSTKSIWMLNWIVGGFYCFSLGRVTQLCKITFTTFLVLLQWSQIYQYYHQYKITRSINLISISMFRFYCRQRYNLDVVFERPKFIS